MPKIWKEGPIGLLNTQSVVKYQRNWRGDPLERKKIRKKKSHIAEKLKGGPFGVFQHPFCRKTSKNWKGKYFIFGKKSHSAEKNERGDPLVSPGMVCYAEKQEKPFWFSSLDQIVHFDAIIFCRTFKNYFGQFVWIEKKSHYNSRVSLYEAPTKN